MISASKLFKYLVNDLTGLYDKNEATSIARIVFNEKLGISRTGLAVEPSRRITGNEEEKINRIAKKILEGMPVQYALGYADFLGLRLKVNKNTLIPRPETEELVQMIIKESKGVEGLRVLDIGTGSGCIALALAKGLNNPQVQAIDISTKALELAKGNSIANETSIEFNQTDILKKSSWQKLGMFDIIVSNPPYVTEKEKAGMHINVLNYEPQIALFVPDNDPLKFYKAICNEALKHLLSDGRLYFEINEAYGEEIRLIAFQSGFVPVGLNKDLSNKDRFIIAENSFLMRYMMPGLIVFDDLGG